MRVTQNYSIHSLLQRVSDARERIQTLQFNLATGKRINRMSDDPEHIETVLRYSNLLKNHERFEKNLKNAIDFMSISSQALDDAIDTMSHAKELAVKGVTGTNNEEWEAMAEQVNQMLKQMVDLGNTRFNGRYVFGGSYTNEQPFTLKADESKVDANSNGIDGALKTEFGDQRIEQYNVTGQDAFMGTVDVFQTLVDLRDAFKAHDDSAVQSLIDQVEQATDQIVQQNGKLGSKINRFELYLQQYQSQDVKLQEFLSGIEDTDVAKAITELQIEQTGLTTALQVLSQTLNISLVDFMK
ncbi:MAG TPA: flagellar hook-associated protein 3 [Caldithrix sp.]|nr:flagellar hook-associated protein 3 [Caldithrix sp.]